MANSSTPLTEEEKITYLLCTMAGRPFPFTTPAAAINTIDDVDECKEPWEISAGPADQEYNFYTKLRNNVGQSEKPVGEGIWKFYDQSSIFLMNGRHDPPIGSVRKFRYHNKRNANESRKWILKEYTIADRFKCCVPKNNEDYALCTIVKKVSGRDAGGSSSGLVTRNLLQGFFDQTLRENSQ
ncbi:hypothetical protein ABFS82_04G169400 [Erythranthe guttata]|uniref:NAC domain-containing protein 72-like n=1 Tax=Erythranthe guttata TaxID=4155 RepID=UPI00064DC384|nr:PREDICTED: NAC domain-containing protein 72-like [Erythranthe guttata]|eukprot:XP_012829177.1 PREDICTED: NAC domain-containing protein 72-like [Erythranthe guttata]